MRSTLRHPLRPLGILLAVGVAAAAIAIAPSQTSSAVAAVSAQPAPNEERNASTVTADPLPTVQIDSGVVWTQTIVGNTVYAGGAFSNARPAGAAPGTNLMPRSNLLAYNLETGIATSFAPAINGEVKALAASPDGTRLYVGGSFNTVNGQTRFNFAAFDTATGQLLTSFRPSAGGSYVNAIVATDSTVYVGGLIGAANGTTRKNFAAYRADNGGLLGWAPTSDLQVDAMVLSPTGDKLIAGGRFTQVNGASQRGLAAISLADASLLPWAAPATVRNGATSGRAGIWALSADADSVYGTGWVFSSVAEGNLEGTFAADAGSGAIKWIADCHGDHYGVYSDGTNVYTTSHQHACETMDGPPQANPAPGNLRHATVYTAAAKGTLTRTPFVSDIYADWSGYPAPAAINWYPDWVTGSRGQAGWTVTGNGKYVVVGGEFPFVNGQRQQGLVRFSNAPPNGPKEGPRLAGDRWAGYSVQSFSSGTARISVPANWDRDDLQLTYRLFRVGTRDPIQTTTVTSRFWDRPTITFNDTGLTPGSTQTYRIVASDRDGNIANSNFVAVEISDQALSPYAEAVLNDGANLYWRLDSAAGSEQLDWAGNNQGTVRNGVTTTSPGAIAGTPSVASSFTGARDGGIHSNATVPVGKEYSMEFWIKTTSTAGGKIAGYGSSATGDSSSYDRHIYMTNDGRLVYGNYAGATQTVTSTRSYNDDVWHHVVGTQGPQGMTLYVDGSAVGSLSSATSAEGYTGFWRIGGDRLGGWPNEPSSSYITASIDEFAVYPRVLTGQQVATHASVGRGEQAPVADFSASARNLDVTFDAAASTAPDGQSVASYRWDFGDGSPVGSGVSPRHTYASAGSFTVALTVTSTAGLTATTTRTIVVDRAPSPPTAVIGSRVDGRTATFDGGGSTAAAGGTIASYQWDFGDNNTSTAPAPVHTFSADGTYTVRLTVVDSRGVSATSSEQIAVAHAAPTATFTSSVSGLTANVDASAASATDGATLSYRWDWGDGTAPSTGVKVSHSYASAGTRSVTLTVTDTLGSSSSITREVTVGGQTVVAQDDFERSISSGWGSASVGGTWSAGPGLSVANGAGKITSVGGQTRSTLLSDVLAADVDARVAFSYDKIADGGGSHWNLLTRKSAAGDYRLKVRTSSSGVVTVNLAKMVGTTETLFAGRTLPGYSFQPGAELEVRVSVVGSGSSTQLQAKVWPSTSPEPAAWTVTANDSTPQLQGAGQIGVLTYFAGSVTNGPIVTSVDRLRVQ